MTKKHNKQHSTSVIIITLVLTIIIVLALSFFSFSVYIKNKKINQEFEALSNNFSDYKQESEFTINNLKQNITSTEKEKNDIQTSLSNVEEEHKKLSEKHDMLVGEVKKTIGKINVYQDELEDSMAWVKDNSMIENEKVQYYLKPGNCYKMSPHTCRIKTGCFFFINKERLGLDYMYDEVTSHEVDQLQSIQQFLENKGGDCEDYSLFYKAEFNHVLNNCLENGAESFTIEAWQPSDNPEEQYWVEFSKMWYILGGTDIILEKDYIYPNVVCGYLYDFVKGDVSGHCIVAFTKEKIMKIDDLESLDGAPLIEPQNGIYLGKVNDDSSAVYLVNEENYENVHSYISIVITDNDLFLFSEEYKEWLSYSVFDEELGETKEKIVEILKN